MAWALHLLAAHPDVEARVHAEVDEILAGRAPDHGDLPKLELTGRTVRETLRLVSPAWIFTRVTSTDTRLGGHDLPTGTTVAFSPYVVHHLPGLHPDPERFDPDRWLGEKVPGRIASIPFGAGPRKCIGDQFAIAEVTLLLARITSWWRLRHADRRPVRPALAVVLRPRRLRMRLESRRLHERRS